MLSWKLLYEYAWAQSQLAGDYSKKVQEVYTRYQLDLEETAADARNKARLLAEKYYGELHAAAMGDDTVERASAAWSVYQREYAKLNEEYLTSSQQHYQGFFDTLQSLKSTAGTTALDDYIGLLQDARNEFAASSKKATIKPDKSGSRGTKGS